VTDRVLKLPPEQQAFRDKCFHPSGTFVDFPNADVESSIPARFDKMVQQYRDRIAVRTETRVVTYGELDTMTLRFARALLQRQGPKVQLVALLLEKDVDQIAAMLGVMRAGKFFLILDPSFPKARLTAMLRDSRAKLIVTNRQNALLANEMVTGARQLMKWETIDDAISGDHLCLSIAPKALAFINYTSGSTGEPKGLLRTHRMILHNIMSRTNLLHVSERDRISLLSSGTSNAITNSLLALLNGAGLYSLEVKKEGVVRLARWLVEEKITIAPMSSPLFRSLCETLNGKNNFPDLRIVRLRSEAVYKEDADLYKTYFSPGCVFVTGLSSNETGPLRDFLIDHQTDVAGSAVPVGYAVPGKDIFLLDDLGDGVSLGEVGEIAVRSRYLSPGYLRRPQLTKAKFTPDPKGEGKRLYLTGDLGVMLPDGCLVYKGRKDFRIKIRGYGVDLKEVELALRKLPAVTDAVVVARENERREKELIGYFTSTFRTRPSESELRSFLGQTLADYMIPSAFVRLDSIPLTPHNKVDRTALPQPAQTRPNLDTPFMAPRSEAERQLAEIWVEVLGIDRVGIHDKFFDSGGNSLAATRILSRVIDKFRLELPLQALFDSPTVEEMAAVISRHQVVDHKPRELRPQQSSNTVEARPVEPTIDDFTAFPKEEVERSVPERFEKIVRMYPDRIAVKTGNDVVTYSELNAMADSLAHAIVSRRGPEAEAVAILLEKGARLMAAMLAVLKAGKFFVLLDRSSPKARLAAVLEDSQAGLIISERQYGEVTRHFNSADSNLLEFDSTASPVAEENLRWNISPNSLATVNYTSGSTGEPKGVIWAHRNLLHQVMLFTNAYKLSECDRLLLTTSGTGNAVVIGFLALLNGAALLPFDVQIHGVNRLVNWLLDEKISICWFGSPLFRNICQALTGEEKFSDVRILRLASEASYKSDIELYKQHFSPECVLINGLSNTESGLICLYPVDFKTEIEGQEVPVGYPVEDKEFLLLDDAGKEVGVNEVGEIAVRSRYLSPGYWHRPELTANKFKPDPNGGDQRIYLSGDLGLVLPDGCLIHKGRKDFRVKIRGYGVEIAEIEKVLNTHAAVGQGVVVAREKESGEARLVAYYTCTGLSTPTVSELRGFLRKQLPDFMIPSTFVMLDAIPLTHSGKVDRHAFPDPDNVRPTLATHYLSSRNEIERKLVAIWEEVLDVCPVGVNDGFFDLGGDSLSAVRVISQVINQFQWEIPLPSMFQFPTIAEMASVIARHQGQRVEKNEACQMPVVSVTPVSREGQLPLSYSQQRLWFLDQLEPGGFTYNLFSAYQLKGELNVLALEQSFNEIIRRHDVLRTVFKSKDGSPVQVILPTVTIKIPVLDLRGTVSEEDRRSEVRRISLEEVQRPFDLACGPLLRITLLRLADDEFVLLRGIHHIVFDAWSSGILFSELAEIYEALSRGKPPPFTDLPVQYADYSVWQRQWFQGERFRSQLSYWKQQLENIPVLQLPADRPRPAIQSSSGARQYFVLSERCSEDLRVLSHRYRVTLFMTLLAAFQALLHRYSGQTDIVIGSPVAGRSRREFEELIGFFLNTLVLRLDLSGNPTFAEALSRVREVCLGALSHQELPFEKLVEELHPDRNLGHNPLFQVTFAFQNTPRFPVQLSGISVNELEMETGVARFDLHLFMEEKDGCLKGYFDYNTDLFNADTIERLLGHFQKLLNGIVTDPHCRISDLPLLTQAEKHQLLVEWNDTKRDYPKNKCIHELFEAQVERALGAVAVVFEDQQLTYRKLNGRANQLAHHLKKLGIGPDVLVGLCVERSLDMIVGILGILKAGGAYVPLDPEYPKERLAFQLDDTKASVLLTQERLLGDLPQHDGRVICLDRDWAEIARENEANSESGVTAENLAYVIYTSGSTGKPKGVMIPHRALYNHMLWMQERFPLDAADCVLQKTPFCFDASVWEFFAPIIAGARLILARPRANQDGAYLIDTIVNQRVTTLQLVPSMLRMLLAEDGLERCQNLKRVFCGGEALPMELREQFHGRLGGELYNLYGPTEATIDATCALCDRGSAPHTVTIGRPIANTQVYVLDPALRPVPIGVPGELYIGGGCLARGYLNRPELTAEKFISHSFDGEPARRLHGTGDLARYLSDGNIEFLGRIDDQVKIRGYRIELGEIESVLSQHPGVRETVVVAREDEPGDKRLVAYLVAASQNSSVSELRDFLRAKLPEYMIPSTFVFLDALPLTLNGKIDRKSLPVPDRNRGELKQAYVAPRGPTEEILVGIWADVLKLDQIGIHDNFFDVGGHSLLATQVISRVRQAFQMDLPLRTIFEEPTIEELTMAIMKKLSERGGGEEMALILTEVESLSDEETKNLLKHGATE
jgi:amino acid adenylation domain-containing protein